MSERHAGPALVYGRNPVLEAVAAGVVGRILVAEGVEPSFRSRLDAAAANAAISVVIVDREHIASLVPSGKAQGVVAERRRENPSTADEIIAAAVSRTEPALLLVLEEMQDPRNVGGAIRSAEAAGCHGVLVTQHRSAPLDGIVSKASAGAIFHIPVGTVASMSALLTQLTRNGIWTVGLDQEARETVFSCDLAQPIALVVGGEGSGLRRLTADRVDILASIPMRGQVGSLNASAAAAITLFEAVRQRM